MTTQESELPFGKVFRRNLQRDIQLKELELEILRLKASFLGSRYDLSAWLLRPKRGRPKGSADPRVREAAGHYRRLKAALDKRGWRGKHGKKLGLGQSIKDGIVDFVLDKMKQSGRPTPPRQSVLNYLNRPSRRQ